METGNKKLTVGSVYEVKHRRKGTFSARVLSVSNDGEFVRLVVVRGSARAHLAYNERDVGESVEVRASFCTFTEEAGS